ncbi:DoxX family membrane protein [Allonocardiopsis opalescens]|uniref:DoxX-like protein n=1 Tax=Allonocardiopsis opalescens TaxID=1144618 RepID=A0A2T0Q1M4_9ACTN|nr:DoxX family membrane protein [Allonocardiopsis opalescens]PRX97702.1 DoxX-like protein [Allonocardiopsis opalescens]
MELLRKARTAPGRLAAGAYILHSGLEKWDGGEEQAAGTHGMAAGAFPFLRSVPPRTFLRLLAATEIATGAALLAPFVPGALAGAALTGFSSGLVALYLRTPALRKPGSVWPTPEGIGVSKDVWLLAIGLGLLADAAAERREH